MRRLLATMLALALATAAGASEPFFSADIGLGYQGTSQTGSIAQSGLYVAPSPDPLLDVYNLDLRTGRNTSPPATPAVATYPTRVRDGRVQVKA